MVGDTVGDPFKDTSGPSLNILLKLMSVVALVIAPSIAMDSVELQTYGEGQKNEILKFELTVEENKEEKDKLRMMITNYNTHKGITAKEIIFSEEKIESSSHQKSL